MTEQTDSWVMVDWVKVRRTVFQIQKRIFRSSVNEDLQNTHRLQRLLVSSYYAKLLAVKITTEESKGKYTPGTDGFVAVNTKQKTRIAQTLTIHGRTQSIRRVFIPKKGPKGAKRPLGIPVVSDRALQNLINLAIEPQIEASLSPNQFGFRKGRSAHDGISLIRAIIQKSEHWALKLDIEKFFDHIDHAALLAKLECYGPLKQSINRILKSKVLDRGIISRVYVGTPQGGPLSPTLANLILSGLERHIHEKLGKGMPLNGKRIEKAPHVIFFADDAVVIHKRRDVLEASKPLIDEWLANFGLNLHPEKTKIVNTLEHCEHPPGFDFVGFRIQQHKVGYHQRHRSLGQIKTTVTPCKSSERQLLDNVGELLKKTFPSKYRKAEYRHKQGKGDLTREEITIIHLNRILRGWSNYFRFGNSTRSFVKLDHFIFRKIWKWLRKSYPKKSTKWLRKNYYSTVHNGKTIWQFNASNKKAETHRKLLLLRSVSLRRHYMVKKGKNYYDGDWVYWSFRSSRYPSIPDPVIKRLKKQMGYCPKCGKKIQRDDKVALEPIPNHKSQPKQLVHTTCLEDITEEH